MKKKLVKIKVSKKNWDKIERAGFKTKSQKSMLLECMITKYINTD